MGNFLKKALSWFLFPAFCGYVIFHGTARAINAGMQVEALPFLLLSVAALFALILSLTPRSARRLKTAWQRLFHS